jgi:thioredoxin reductase
VYIAGELGGRGLIKNAINEGKMAAESVAKSLREFPSSSSPEVLDVAIIGSGPAGLSAALEAKRLGLRAAVFEQGTLADSIRKYPRHKLLLAEPVRIPLFGDLWIEDASKETLIATWETAIRHSGLEVRTGCRVQDVVRDVDGFKISGEGVSASARRVILATGRRGTPRRLGVPGEELDKVFYDIVEMEAFRGRRVLVVGGGDSAVESAVGLAAQQGTTTTLSYRGSELARVKERNLEKLEREVQQGRVGLLLNSRVRKITPDEVFLNVAEDKTLRLPNDNVIVRIGGEPPALFLERVGVRTVRKEITLEASRDAVHA